MTLISIALTNVPVCDEFSLVAVSVLPGTDEQTKAPLDGHISFALLASRTADFMGRQTHSVDLAANS
jgi:hypothetical protein